MDTNHNKTLAYVLTVGGNNINKDKLLEVLFQLNKSKFKTYIIFRDDVKFVKNILTPFFQNEKFVIVETLNSNLKKIGKIKLIVKQISEDYIKFIDPDDEIDPNIEFLYWGDSDFLNVKMFTKINNLNNELYRYNIKNTNPSTIFKTANISNLNNFTLKYDSIFNEDIYRFIFASLLSNTNKNVTNDYLPFYFGSYVLYEDSSMSSLTKRKNKYTLRLTLRENFPKDDFKLLIDDILQNIDKLDNKNIGVLFDILIFLLIDYYIIFKELVIVMPIINRISLINNIEEGNLIDAILRRSSETIKYDKRMRKDYYFWFKSIANKKKNKLNFY